MTSSQHLSGTYRFTIRCCISATTVGWSDVKTRPSSNDPINIKRSNSQLLKAVSQIDRQHSDISVSVKIPRKNAHQVQPLTAMDTKTDSLAHFIRERQTPRSANAPPSWRPAEVTAYYREREAQAGPARDTSSNAMMERCSRAGPYDQYQCTASDRGSTRPRGGWFAGRSVGHEGGRGRRRRESSSGIPSERTDACGRVVFYHRGQSQEGAGAETED
jgi:hypothetical protein